jgi:hypothetical protein
MDRMLTCSDVRDILEYAGDHPWRWQDTGVLGLWLDPAKTTRLHVWTPADAIGEPVIHDHPFSFSSTVIVGALVNTRYIEDPSGEEYVRDRYSPGHEHERRADRVRLVGMSETLRAGARYRQAATELHDSRQVPGTVTLLHFDDVVDDLPELTTCRRPGTPFVSGRARAATLAEVRRVTALALAWFTDAR